MEHKHSYIILFILTGQLASCSLQSCRLSRNHRSCLEAIFNAPRSSCPGASWSRWVHQRKTRNSHLSKKRMNQTTIVSQKWLFLDYINVVIDSEKNIHDLTNSKGHLAWTRIKNAQDVTFIFLPWVDPFHMKTGGQVASQQNFWVQPGSLKDEDIEENHGKSFFLPCLRSLITSESPTPPTKIPSCWCLVCQVSLQTWTFWILSSLTVLS